MAYIAQEIWKKINTNDRLKTLELQGLERGEQRGKVPHVPANVLMNSLTKQFNDLCMAMRIPNLDKEKMEKCLADLRNVAGIFFLNLEGDTFEDVKHVDNTE